MRLPALPAVALLLAAPSWAQHDHEQHAEHGQHAAEPAEPRLFQSEMAAMTGMMPRDPMDGMSLPAWKWMVTGVARILYNDQGGPSGGTVGESTNWNMVMGMRDVGPGRLTLMMMNSLEPATIHDGGSPQLFQTGETFEGKPLVDRQHAHDFFMNLSATWRVPFGTDAALWVHAAPVGEPALGPAAFMHRASAGENPTAPLAHHWQDSTHITSNVITAGGGTGLFGFEVSAFHGEEPDEHRWGIDGGGIDSYSGRITLRARGPWSAQVSCGHIEDPEALEPGDVTRMTASVHYGAQGSGPLAVSLVWGRNDEDHGTTDSFLLEGAYAITELDQVFGRAEYVEKDETLLATKQLGVGGDVAAIRALTLGYLRAFPPIRRLETGLGVDLTGYAYPDSLDAAYGDSPVAAHLFARVRWSAGHRHQHG
jgi:hypothetical protein